MYLKKWSIEVLFELAYGLKLGSDKVTGLGSLVTKNDGGVLI